ncbi:hypothetical protein KN815_03060 [Streptomyces sp. 4503]|uniref:Transporter n=1 Tax=Streptomyces niphimycinicus TaxID=2842201 RepID=A0ABS6C8A8_9ACTN|nr:hypothetical protein [Streptomyces niphimycinicus]MBU3863113.1 hypothetical protein [Streptomyces niphimycinicus]
MGVVILLVMAAGVAAMLTRKLPTAFALVLLAVAIAFLADAPLTGKGSVLDTVLQEGAPALAATMIAILLGSWPITLFVAIGILLAAVKLPGAVDALQPLVKSISPQNTVLFILVFTLLVPLCLFRGPLNVFGLGAGIAGVLVATGIYPAVAVLGMTASYNQVFGVSDPTSTQTVWSAQYAGVSPHQVMLRTLPYVWAVAFGGLCVTAFTEL